MLHALRFQSIIGSAAIWVLIEGLNASLSAIRRRRTRRVMMMLSNVLHNDRRRANYANNCDIGRGGAAMSVCRREIWLPSTHHFAPESILSSTRNYLARACIRGCGRVCGLSVGHVQPCKSFQLICLSLSRGGGGGGEHAWCVYRQCSRVSRQRE